MRKRIFKIFIIITFTAGIVGIIWVFSFLINKRIKYANLKTHKEEVFELIKQKIPCLKQILTQLNFVKRMNYGSPLDLEPRFTMWLDYSIPATHKILRVEVHIWCVEQTYKIEKPFTIILIRRTEKDATRIDYFLKQINYWEVKEVNIKKDFKELLPSKFLEKYAPNPREKMR